MKQQTNNNRKYNLEYYYRHREESKKRMREYYQKNKDKILLQQSDYNKKNADKRRSHQKIINKKNRKKITDRVRKFRQNNPHARIRINLLNRIKYALKNQSTIKSQNLIQLIGCSTKELKQYIESKFLPGMTWDNYGQWHIDHIKPCASYDLTNIDQQKECFHYSNLQSLWAHDNQIKGCKVKQ